MVITPEGEKLVADASVSVNGKQASGVQVGLVLAGDLALSVTAGIEGTQHMRAVASGATGLAEGLREQVFSTLEAAIAQALQPKDGENDNGENSLVTSA